MSKQRLRTGIVTLGLLVTVFLLIIFFAKEVAESEALQNLIYQFGYTGVLLVGFIAGLNTFIPVHAATFAPVFVSAGLYIPFIIVTLAIGTMLADSVGFLIGKVSRTVIEETYPKIHTFFVTLHSERQKLVLPLVFLYAALVPFPNEAILIPLALAGVRFPTLVLPLIIGNIVNHTLWVYGFTNLFELVV